MNRLRIALFAAMTLLAVGIFAAIPHHASDAPMADKSVDAARLNNIGVAYMNQQLFEKALKSFEAALAADPKLTIARLNRGIALLNLQKVDEAKIALEEAAKENPKDPRASYNLGLFYKNSS